LKAIGEKGVSVTHTLASPTMSDFTDFTENQIVSWMVGGDDFPSAHSTVYVGLHSNDPTNSGEENELSSSSYEREDTAAGVDWTINGNQAENAQDIIFPEAQEDWGQVSHVTLWDSASGGNAIGHSPIDQTVEINENDQLRFPAGELTITVQ
jgi:hypothetical protein